MTGAKEQSPDFFTDRWWILEVGFSGLVDKRCGRVWKWREWGEERCTVPGAHFSRCLELMRTLWEKRRWERGGILFPFRCVNFLWDVFKLSWLRKQMMRGWDDKEGRLKRKKEPVGNKRFWFERSRVYELYLSHKTTHATPSFFFFIIIIFCFNLSMSWNPNHLIPMGPIIKLSAITIGPIIKLSVIYIGPYF